jgi:CheY-like chemotaxis protein
VESYKNSANQQHPSEGGYSSNVKSGIKPEVILMDINMPVMDGFEAARAIRRFEHASGSSRATIIAVTGLGDRMAQERAFASGMDLFLTKPVKMKDVTAIVSGLRRTDHK